MRNASIGRRRFVTLLGAAAAWPLAVRGESPRPVIGFLSSASQATFERFVAEYRASLAETGFGEGKNVAIEFRWADGHYDRLPALAAELVRLKVDVILASGGAPPAFAAKAATSTIPIVFTAISDPLEGGLVASLNRPGGNLTGITILTAELDPKRLELLSALVPAAKVVAVLANPNRSDAEKQSADVQAAAAALGRELVILRAGNESEIHAAFAKLRERGAGALAVLADPYFTSRREQIVALAARYHVPAMYQWREFVVAGGLMSYGPSILDAYRQAGIYTGRILKGEKPADLPVLQPTKFELVLNLKTANALGLSVTEPILARADEVIE
ncbi:MAG TPA: ABC transporter substrate-binding protein [Alphaproteobacteria bacterium]|jgi:putative ABC transport system substrate-binding protein